MSLLWVFLGGGLGAVARYGVSLALPRAEGGFPWATLVVNVSGALLIGLCFAFMSGRESMRLFLIVGLLGGFTTFSTLSLETLTLLQAREGGQALAYVSLTLFAGFLACWIGLRIGHYA